MASETGRGEWSVALPDLLCQVVQEKTNAVPASRAVSCDNLGLTYVTLFAQRGSVCVCSRRGHSVRATWRLVLARGQGIGSSIRLLRAPPAIAMALG